MLQQHDDNPPEVTSIAERRGRSLGCLAVVRKYSTARGSARAVLTVIAAHADADGTGAWPSTDTIAAEAGLSVSAVKRARRKLIADGELEVVEAGGGRRSNRYRIAVAAMLEAAAVTLPERDPARSGAGSDRPSRGVTLTQQGGQSDPRPYLDRPLTERSAPAVAGARCTRHTGHPAPPPCRACAAARTQLELEATAARAAVEARHAARVKDELRAIAEAPPADPAVVARARAEIRAAVRRSTTPKPAR